ncbi:MAG: type I glyceraldehyde-3-phosphate dehydrogenase [Minisyncoccia bacterium]
MIKVAINGFGRIGRLVFRRIIDFHKDIEVVAINDLGDVKTLVHLLKYDSVFGIYQKPIKIFDDYILLDDKKVKIFSFQNPEELPWKELDIDIVLECTGVFTDFDGARKHLLAGAKKVIISAPSKTPEKIPSFVLGVNEKNFNPKEMSIVDMGSCTTNCLAPIVKVLHENFKIKDGFFSTIHSYTNDQRILDLFHKDLRRARAAGLNIIPTSTGAAKTIGKIFPDLQGKLDGLAFRVPTPDVSVLDLVCNVEKKTTKEEVNYIFREESKKEELKGILGIEDALLVSSDYIGNTFSAVIDSSLTQVINNVAKIVAWYDNEWAYSCRLAEFTEYVGKKMFK